MADLQKQFETGGSTLAVPVSPNSSPSTPDNISVVGNSLLHNEYSNIGTPESNAPAYNNFGAGSIGYATPETSRQGLASEKYQRKVNRYRNNLPPGASF